MKFAQEIGERLQGEPNGRRAFAIACEKLSGIKIGEMVTLDFSDVLVVTASWISAMLLPLYRWAADEQTDLYFVIAYGPDSDWLDDLRLVARHNRRLFLVRSSVRNEDVRLLGPMDDAERRTLERVAELGEATGALLERECPGEKIKATGWNNRLKDLHDKRVLRRIKRGREQVYSLAVRGITLNG